MRMNDADETQTTESQTLEVEDSDNDIASSPTLARLIEEVRNEEELTGHAYNRMHNRHNRSR